MNIGKLFGAMLGVTIGLALFPVVFDIARETTHDYNGSAWVPIETLPSGVSGLVGILPLLYIVLIVAGAIAFVKWKG